MTTDHVGAPLPVVRAAGDLDTSNLAPLEAELQAALATAPGVILDVSGVTFGDSTLLNLLIRVHQRTDLRIVGLRPPLDRLFQIVGLDAVMQVFPTLADARTVLRRPDIADTTTGPATAH
ncbi:STAS domain-containing protein [Streptomyces sp. V4-01]|uniref:STAS domain-containing protein n=1 Tax=Actinacidiphila polyblastidii TaxID=3110430 RepID=A0ABU7PMI4_9ACTN|nr:STAS domain-containing protein [Streptomyces sp. V4-01]